jgi:hypothetical protein
MKKRIGIVITILVVFIGGIGGYFALFSFLLELNIWRQGSII